MVANFCSSSTSNVYWSTKPSKLTSLYESLYQRDQEQSLREKKRGRYVSKYWNISSSIHHNFRFCARKCRILWCWSSSPSTYWELQEEAMVMHEDMLLDSSAEVMREVVAQQQQQRVILKILLRVWWCSGVRLQQHLPGWWRRNRLILLSGLRKKKPKLILSFLHMLFFFSQFSSPPSYQLPIARVSARTYRAHKRSANLLGSRNQTPPPISQAMLWRESDAVTQSGSRTSAVLLPRRLPSNLQVHPRDRDRILRSSRSHSFASSPDCRSPTKFWTLLESLVRTRTISAGSWSSCESWEIWNPRDGDEELPQMAKASYTSSRDWRSFSTDSLLLLLLLFSHKKSFSPDVAFKENKSLSGKSYKIYTCATLQIDEEMNKARQYSSGSIESPGSSSWSHLRECFLFFVS